MKPGTIIFEGTSKKGTPIVIRYPTMEDAQAMSDYINVLSREQTFILFQGEHMSLADEEKFLTDHLKKIEKNDSVFLLVFANGKQIGASGVDMKIRAEKHVGIFGISIAKEYRGEGIGKLLMEKVLHEAEKNIVDLKIVTLGVFANNPLAQQMYKKFGFIQYGNLPKGILHKGLYIDHIYMYKKIRNL